MPFSVVDELADPGRGCCVLSSVSFLAGTFITLMGWGPGLPGVLGLVIEILFLTWFVLLCLGAVLLAIEFVMTFLGMMDN